MKKLKWGNNDDREVHPSKENMVIISALDTVIERICKSHTFKSMFENMSYSEYLPEKMDNESQYSYGNFKDFLEEKFVSIRKVNKYRMIPAFYSWVLQFYSIEIRITKEQAQELLTKDFESNKTKIHPYLDWFVLDSYLFYDLTDDKFIAYI